MLSARVVRGGQLGDLSWWAAVAAASAGTGVLLLSALGWALGHPRDGGDGAVRLVWCVLPVVVTVRLAVVVGRALPGRWPRSGLAAVGLGRSGVALVCAAAAALVCTAGSVLALLVFLHLRGDLTGVPFDGAASGGLGAGRPLPLAAAVTLLALVPLCVAASGMRPPPARWARPPDQPAAPAGATPDGLPWGVALTAVGLAVEATAPAGHELPLPGGLGAIPPAAVAGWTITTVGLVLVGPGVVHACGRLLATYRPGALRLLSGRALQEEARSIGHALGLLAATAAAALAAYDLSRGGSRPLGPLTVFGAVLVTGCVLATVALQLREARRARGSATRALRALGASPTLLRTAAGLRAAVLTAAAIPLTTLVALLATVPTSR